MWASPAGAGSVMGGAGGTGGEGVGAQGSGGDGGTAVISMPARMRLRLEATAATAATEEPAAQVVWVELRSLSGLEAPQEVPMAQTANRGPRAYRYSSSPVQQRLGSGGGSGSELPRQSRLRPRSAAHRPELRPVARGAWR